MPSARATRNTRVASMRATVTISTAKVEPSPEITISAIMMAGNEMSASTMRLRTASTQPPRTAARNPVADPIRKARSGDGQGQAQGHPRSVDETRREVAPEEIAAEQQVPAGRHEAVVGENRALVVRRQPRRDQGDAREARDDEQADAGRDRELRSKLAKRMRVRLVRLRHPCHFGYLSLGLATMATMATTSASRFNTT